MNELNKNGLVHPKQAKKLSLSSQKRAIKLEVNCFYNCSFKAGNSQLMEEHYRKQHYLRTKEATHG